MKLNLEEGFDSNIDLEFLFESAIVCAHTARQSQCLSWDKS